MEWVACKSLSIIPSAWRFGFLNAFSSSCDVIDCGAGGQSGSAPGEGRNSFRALEGGWFRARFTGRWPGPGPPGQQCWVATPTRRRVQHLRFFLGDMA